MKKHLGVNFAKECQKLIKLMPRLYLLTGGTSQVSILSLHKIKMSKQHKYIHLLHIVLMLIISK